MSRSEFESMLRDDFFADALLNAPRDLTITWQSMIWHETYEQLVALREAILDCGIECDPIRRNFPRRRQYSFDYRIHTIVAEIGKLVSRIGDVYDLEKRHGSRGASWSLLAPDGKCLLK